MTRAATGAVLLTLGLLAALDSPAGWSDPGDHHVPAPRTVTVQAKRQGHGVDWWAARAVRNRRALNRYGKRLRANHAAIASLTVSIRRLRRESRNHWAPTVRLAVAYARAVYGVDQTRRVQCESHGDVYAHNASGATSILQFLPSTWRTTPFAGFSIWDPVAQALAGGWMVQRGRSGEWTCGL